MLAGNILSGHTFLSSTPFLKLFQVGLEISRIRCSFSLLEWQEHGCKPHRPKVCIFLLVVSLCNGGFVGNGFGQKTSSLEIPLRFNNQHH